MSESRTSHAFNVSKAYAVTGLNIFQLLYDISTVLDDHFAVILPAGALFQETSVDVPQHVRNPTSEHLQFANPVQQTHKFAKGEVRSREHRFERGRQDCVLRRWPQRTFRH